MHPIDRSHFENKDLPVINVDGREGHILDYTTIAKQKKFMFMKEVS